MIKSQANQNDAINSLTDKKCHIMLQIMFEFWHVSATIAIKLEMSELFPFFTFSMASSAQILKFISALVIDNSLREFQYVSFSQFLNVNCLRCVFL